MTFSLDGCNSIIQKYVLCILCVVYTAYSTFIGGWLRHCASLLCFWVLLFFNSKLINEFRKFWKNRCVWNCVRDRMHLQNTYVIMGVKYTIRPLYNVVQHSDINSLNWYKLRLWILWISVSCVGLIPLTASLPAVRQSSKPKASGNN